MSYTLHFPTLTLDNILCVLPTAEIHEEEYDGHLIITLLWHEPDHIKDNNDLYGVEIRFINNGKFLSKKQLQNCCDIVYLHIDKGHTICWNGQSILQDKLEINGFEIGWID
jgi:hypothetical protein